MLKGPGKNLTVQTNSKRVELPDIKSPVANRSPSATSHNAALNSRGSSRSPSRVGSHVLLPPDAQSDLDSLMLRLLQRADKGPSSMPSSELSAKMIRGLNRRLSELEFLVDKEDQKREKLRHSVEDRLVKIEERQQAEFPALKLTESVKEIEATLLAVNKNLKGVIDASSQHETRLTDLEASISPPSAIEAMVSKVVSDAISSFQATRAADLQELERLKQKVEASEKARLDLESKLSLISTKLDKESKQAIEEKTRQAKIKSDADAETEKALKRERDRASAVVEMMERVEVVEALIKEMKSAKPAPVAASKAASVKETKFKESEVKEKEEEKEETDVPPINKSISFNEGDDEQSNEGRGISLYASFKRAPTGRRPGASMPQDEEEEEGEEEPEGLPPPKPAIKAKNEENDPGSKLASLEVRLEKIETQMSVMASSSPSAPVSKPEDGESAAEESGTMAEKIEALASQLEEAKKVWSLSQTKQHSHLPTSATTGLSAEFAIQNLTAHIHAVEARLEKFEQGENGDEPEKKLSSGNSLSRLSQHQRGQDDLTEEKVAEMLEAKVKVIDDKLRLIEDLLRGTIKSEEAADKKALKEAKDDVMRQVVKLQEETARALTTTYEQMTAMEQGLSVTVDELQQRLTSVLTVLVQRVKVIEAQLHIEPGTPGDAGDGVPARGVSLNGKSPLGAGS